MDDFLKLKNKRSTYRTQLTKLFAKIETVLKDQDSELETLESELELLLSKDCTVKELNSEIEKCLKPEEIETEINKCSEYEDKVILYKTKLRKRIKQLQPDSDQNNSGNNSTLNSSEETSIRVTETKTVKLPKLMISKYYGEPDKYLDFINQYENAIHNNPSLTDIDKFNYLKSLLGGIAANAISGFSLTGKNYAAAITLLKQRFGNHDMLIHAHLNNLLNIPPIKSISDIRGLRNLYDKCETQIRSLEALGVAENTYSCLLCPILLKLLPCELTLEFMRIQDNDKKLDVQTLLNFLRNEVESREKAFQIHKSEIKSMEMKPQKTSGRTNERYKGNINSSFSRTPTRPGVASIAEFLASTNNDSCLFCRKAHRSENCDSFNVNDRKNFCKRHWFCFLCMKPKHRLQDCVKKDSFSCSYCNGLHNIALCFKRENEKKETLKSSKIDNTVTKHVSKSDNSEAKHVNTEQNKIDCTVSNHVNNEQNKILLQTAAVKLVGKLSSKVIRSLYDPGSQRSFIRKDLSRQLSLNKVGEEELFIHTFGSKAPTRIKCDRVQVKIRDILDKDEVIIEALEIDEVSSAPLEFAPIDVISELKTEGINLCDVNYGILGSENISLLIGADHYFNIVSGKIKRLNPKLVAIESKFGWLLMGEVEGRNSSNRDATSAMSTISLFVSGSSIENLWKLDTLGIRDPVEVQSRKETEIEVLNYFKKTVTVNNEGRYEVHLPWVADQIILNANEDICKDRLKSVTNKLLQKNKLEDYEAVFSEWIEDGVIEEVPFNEIEKKSHYLPHRGVFKESSTTKVRPVFDASCRGKNSLSLNDCLEKGPNLLEEIPPILLRFRKEKIGVVSDIKRAFLQISIFKPDCEFLRFLWWDNLKEERVKTFRHKRLVFGLNCSPFILGAVLNYHLEKNFEKYPETVSRLMKSFYVDNCVTSVPDDDTLHRFIEESKHILATACFDLRGWEHTSFNIDPDPSDPIPVLGLLWNKDEDNIFCDTAALKCPSTNLTRRNVLSIIHKIFDPLGILCPATLIPKLLIQKSWNLKIGWDTVLPDDYQRDFSSWLRDVNCLSDVKIPRCLNIDTIEGLSLHVFCDASKTAYSTVIFLRKFEKDTISVSFVSAKSRVAPLRKTTIPRLELLGCCIGARLSAVVIKALNLGDIPIYYWTDSSTALFWIEKDENWGVFVKNRVQEIKSLTSNGIWRHVPGNLNAADLPSRGCSISTLFKSRWWEGPDWLKRNEEEWPKSDVVLNDEEIQKEKRKTVASHLTVTKEKWYLKYFFSYFKIVRMTSWILRFIRNCRQPQEKMKGSLTIQEIDKAEKKLLKIVQDESFSGEGNLKGLLTYVDQDGLYRLKTKIIRREDTEDFRCPIVLPSNDELVHRLIFDHHLQLSHAGVQFVLTHLRQRFWILRGRKTVQRVLSKCILCKRHTARAVETLPSALPEDRIRDASAFEVTGVDVAGPLHLKTAKKAWILIFTCAVYRAVHLELIESLSTNGFLLGLRRFIARRGRPSMIYSDNGSNFVGANRLLKAIDWNQISNFSSEMRIQWKFNPPTASWWGGWWERLIQTVKKLLRRVLGKACLTFEEMSTILCDVEAVINSRPLTYLSEDPTDLEPLTPLLFIQDIKTVGVPDIDKLDKINLTKRWRYHQRLREQFRKRFRDEYLGLLVQKPLKRKFVRPIEINDIVLVGQENLKRSEWPIGRVMGIYPGKDNQVRVVKVKTKAGELTRPVKKLYPLELSSLA